MNLEKFIIQELSKEKEVNLIYNDIIKSLIIDKKLLQYLEYILKSQPIKIKEILSKSYIHYNGFYKITLLDSIDPKFKLRLHFWAKQPTRLYSENIHDHKWNYSSCVLKGNLTMEEYKLSKNGKTKFSYEYLPINNSGTHKLNYLGKKEYKKLDERNLTESSIYFYEYFKLHRIIPNIYEDCATLLFHGPYVNSDNVLIGSENEIISNENMVSKKITQNELLMVLNSVIPSLRNYKIL